MPAGRAVRRRAYDRLTSRHAPDDDIEKRADEQPEHNRADKGDVSHDQSHYVATARDVAQVGHWIVTVSTSWYLTCLRSSNIEGGLFTKHWSR